MRKALVRGDVTIDQLDELLKEEGLSPGERDFIPKLQSFANATRPKRTRIEELERKLLLVQEELKSRKFNSIQRRVRIDAMENIKKEIEKEKRIIKGDLKKIEGKLSFLRRLRKIPRQFQRLPDSATLEWHLWLFEEPPRAVKNKIAIGIGWASVPFFFGALAIPIALTLPPVWLISAAVGGAALGGSSLITCYGIGYREFNVFKEMMPIENFGIYESAKASNVFDGFVVATPGKDFGEDTSYVLFGMIGEVSFRPITEKRGYGRDSYNAIVGYEARVRDVNGYLFEITRW